MSVRCRCAFGDLVGSWAGTCAFRLMPTDHLVTAGSDALTTVEAGGWGWSLRNTWTHPDDGDGAYVVMDATWRAGPAA